ncbi:MAG: hypothetical protein JNM84_27375 [Planctomycetes bacterium]|nr:hypothetical protein [Planctomycetota bacterium]
MRTTLSLALLVGAATLAPNATAQRFVSLDGTPGLTSVVAPPTAVGPLCAPAGVCPVPLPPFPPGIVMPSVGGEAVDEVAGVVYSSNGVFIAASAMPGCAPGPVIPTAAWPAGPCGAIAATPIVAMSDAAGAGTIWVLNAGGLVSLIPFPPGPPLAQGFMPGPAVAGMMVGITWNPATGLLYFVAPGGPAVLAALPPAGFLCGPLPIVGAFPIPPCLPPPYIGLTVNTAVAPGPIPAITVSNGVFTADLITGCACPVAPPAAMPTTDIDFVNAPNTYGAGCGCAATIGYAGGFPNVGNAGFGITATGAPTGSLGILLLSGAPAFLPLGPCTLLVAPGFLTLPAVPTVGGGGAICGATAGFPLPIPPGAALAVGSSFYLQWAFVPSPSPLGFEFSDAMEMTIGFP